MIVDCIVLQKPIGQTRCEESDRVEHGLRLILVTCRILNGEL